MNRNRKSQEKRARRERTVKVLKMIALGVLIIGIGAAPSPHAIGRLLRGLTLGDTRENRRYVGRKLKELKKRGLLEKQGVRYAVSDKGKRLLSREQVWGLRIPTPRRWDERWHLIMFDIPQSESGTRKELNRILLGMGLVQYQQSVLVYPYPIKETLVEVCRFYKITRYVSFVAATELDGTDELKRHFKLA